MGMVRKWGENIRKRAVEALGGSLLGSAGYVDDNNTWRPISARAKDEKLIRELTPLSHAEMLRVSLYLYGSNPLAKWLVNMPVGLAIGQELGYTISIDADRADGIGDPKELTAKIRKVLDKFWYHPVHRIGSSAPKWAKTYLVTGHLVVPITSINDVDGIPRLDLIDAGQLCGVDPLEGSAIVAGKVRYKDVSAANAEESLDILQANDDGLLIPEPGEDGKLPCLYFAHSEILNSLRGISVLMDVADWLDSLDQFAWASLDKAKLRNKIVWLLTMDGKNGDQLQAEANALMVKLQQPGGVYAGNEKTELEAKSANLGSADTVELGRMILAHILGSKGFPLSWYGSGIDSNRATTSEQTDVAYKSLGALQTELAGIFRTFLWMAYDSAQAKQPSAFPKRTESPWLTIEPALPTIQERDISRLAASIGQAVSALLEAVDGELLSRKTAQGATLQILGKVTGGTYEADEEQARIDGEAGERAKKDAEKANALARVAQQQALRRRPAPGTPPGPPPPAKGGQPALESFSKPGDTHFHLPALTLNNPGGTVVEVKPEVRAPDVHVHPPAALAPDVKVTVEAAKIPPAPVAPVFVHVEAPAPPPPNVTIENVVNVPAPAPLHVERDRAGKITDIVPKE